MNSSDIVFDALNSTNLMYATFPGKDGTIEDVINFGFSFVESQDNYVSYVITNSAIMKIIIGFIPESILEPTKKSLGKLWTSDLVLSSKIKENRIVFSNLDYSAVLVLSIPIIR